MASSLEGMAMAIAFVAELNVLQILIGVQFTITVGLISYRFNSMSKKNKMNPVDRMKYGGESF